MADIKTLIAGRSTIHAAASAARSSPTPTAPLVDVVAVASSDPEHWEFFVAASEYLLGLGQAEEITIPALVAQIQSDDEAMSFINAATVPPVALVLRAGRDLGRIVGANVKINLVEALSETDYCYEKCGDDAACLIKCLLRLTSATT